MIPHSLCIEHNIPEVVDENLPQHPNFGLYNVDENGVKINRVVPRVNSNLAEGLYSKSTDSSSAKYK